MIFERRKAYRCPVPPGQDQVQLVLPGPLKRRVPGKLVDESAGGFGVLVDPVPIKPEERLLLRIPAGWVQVRVAHVCPQGNKLRLGLQLLEELFSPEEEQSTQEESLPLYRARWTSSLWKLGLLGAVFMGAFGLGLIWFHHFHSEHHWGFRIFAQPEVSHSITNPTSSQPNSPDTPASEVLSLLEQHVAEELGPEVFLQPQAVELLQLSPRQQEGIRLIAQSPELKLGPHRRRAAYFQARALLSAEQLRRWQQFLAKMSSKER